MVNINQRDYPYNARTLNALRGGLGDERFLAECKASAIWTLTDDDILRLPNMGRKSLAHIQEVLAEHGGRLLRRGEPHPVSTLREAAQTAAETALNTLKHCGHMAVSDTEIFLRYSIHGEDVTEIPPEHQPRINGAIRVTIEFL